MFSNRKRIAELEEELRTTRISRSTAIEQATRANASAVDAAFRARNAIAECGRLAHELRLVAVTAVHAYDADEFRAEIRITPHGLRDAYNRDGYFQQMIAHLVEKALLTDPVVRQTWRRPVADRPQA